MVGGHYLGIIDRKVSKPKGTFYTLESMCKI